MKKLLAAILSLCFAAIFLAGCGFSDALDSRKSTTDATEASSQAEEIQSSVKDTDFDDSFDGLCDYFTAKGYNVENAGKPVEDTNVTIMDASLIGAEKGKKFATTYNGKQIYVELYYYDAENLSDTAKEIIDSVKTDGTFRILPDNNGEKLPAVTAYLSDNGKYLMIYSDASIDVEKPDTNSVNYTHREQVIEDFKAFHK